MAYRHDADLEFLGQMKSEDLGDLVYCLTHDKDGSVRLTEELTTASAYKANYPDHHAYWELIAAEIQGSVDGCLREDEGQFQQGFKRRDD